MHGKTAAATIYDAAIDGLVVSCVGIKDIDGLEDLYTSVKNTVTKIAANGRIVIVSKIDNSSVLSFTVQRSIDAFTRALSKEIEEKRSP